MTTLMRNGRDRRSGKPVKGHAILERALLVGTRSADHIRASGHSGRIATGQASTRKQAGYMAAPERFAKRQIPLAPRAPSIHGPSRHFSDAHCLVVIRSKADIDSCILSQDLAGSRVTQLRHGLVVFAVLHTSAINDRLAVTEERSDEATALHFTRRWRDHGFAICGAGAAAEPDAARWRASEL